jgi:hypothetical protein
MIVFLVPVLLMGRFLFNDGIILYGLLFYFLPLETRMMQLLCLSMSLLFFRMLMIDLSFLFCVDCVSYYFMRLRFFGLFFVWLLLMMLYLICFYFRLCLDIFTCLFTFNILNGLLFLLILICFKLSHFRFFYFDDFFLLLLCFFLLLNNLLIVLRIFFYSNFFFLFIDDWDLLLNLIFRLFMYLKNSLLFWLRNMLFKFFLDLFFFMRYRQL